MAKLRIEQYSGAGLDQKAIMQMPMVPLTADAIELTTSGTTQASAKLAGSTRALFIRSSGGKVTVNFGPADSVVATQLKGASLDDGEGRWFAVDATQVQSTVGLAVAVIDRT